MAESFDLVVIGFGEAGGTTVAEAVKDGHRVAVVYKDPWGSTCGNTGCAPSKFMIHRARIAHQARTSERYHVRVPSMEVDLEGIVDEKNRMVRDYREPSFEKWSGHENVTVFKGDARFRSRNEVEVAGKRLTAPTIVIATGLRPMIPKLEGLDTIQPLTSESLMELKDVPQHLLILGGGYVACELGQTFRRYGSQVTIIQRGERILEREEEEASRTLQDAFREEGIRILTSANATRVERVGGGVRLHVESQDGGGTEVLEGSHLVLAVGRGPNTDTMDLDAAGVETDEKGHVKVNDHMETNVPGIYAVGDVNGQQPFTRVGQEEGKVAYLNAFRNENVTMQRHFLPHAIYTDPSVAAVGYTEAQAREAGHDVQTHVYPYSGISKADIIAETRGFVKLVVETDSRRLLGCTIAGTDADNLIYSAVLVMRHEGTLDEIAKAVGVYPTLQEGVEWAAQALLGEMDPEEADKSLVAAYVPVARQPPP